MGAITELIVTIIANLAGLLIAQRLVSGVTFGGSIEQIFLAAGALTLLSMTLKPILKALFGPVIVFTLGLGLIIVNALMLLILDNLFQNLSIQGIPAFIYTALIVSIVNFLLHILIKK